MTDTQRHDGTGVPSPGAVELVAELHAILDKLQTVDLSPCTDAELADIAADTECAIARLTVAGDRQIDQVEARDLPRKAGCRTLMQFMTHRLRVSNPTRRRKQMDATATRTSLGGDILEPEHPCLAEAFARGAVGTAHVQAALDVLDRIPNAVDHDVKVAAERQMAEIAIDHTPADITQLGARLLAHLDPDGTLADDTDQKRRRGVWIGRQRADGTATISGTLSPELNARLTMMFAVWGKPGLNNPDDPASPSGPAGTADPDALALAADRDGRTLAQTNHDALDAALPTRFSRGSRSSKITPPCHCTSGAGNAWQPANNASSPSRAPTAKCARLPGAINPPPTSNSITPTRIGPRVVSPTSTTSHPPARDTTAWSATNPANTPPGSNGPDPTKAAASGG